MIEVRCAACDEDFSVPDESAGKAELCPSCGSLNDVPEESPVTALAVGGVTRLTLIESPAFQQTRHVVHHRRGIPVALWWFLVFFAVAAFIGGIIYESADTWEQKHLSQLVGLSVTGDHLMDAADFDGAAGKYQSILNQVGNRHLDSDYLIELVKTVKLRLARAKTDAEIARHVASGDEMMTVRRWKDAAADYNDALALFPATIDPSDPIALLHDRASKGHDLAIDPAAQAAAEATPAPVVVDPPHSPATQRNSEEQSLAAIKRFQRDGEAFANFAANKTFLFLDPDGKWRQRQYVVWDVKSVEGAVPQPGKTQLDLEYSASSRTTGPHKDRFDATSDMNFNVDEPDRYTHHATTFVLVGDRWTARDRRRSDGDHWLDAESRQFAVKRADGSIEKYLGQELWQMEDQAFGH